MYHLKPASFQTDRPVFQKIDSDNCLFFPEYKTAKWFAEQGVPEQALINWSHELLRPDQWFVDIGAHVGTYTLSLAQRAAGVHAFECSPRTYNFLCANIALHGLDYRVKTYNVALGHQTGTTRYYIRSGDGGGNGCLEFEKDRSNRFVEVPMKRLDDYNLENVGLIKIDVEGYEKQVLQGAQETLRRNGYPKILFESWEDWRETEGVPAGQLRRELFDYIHSLGYRIVSINGNREMFLAEPI